MLDIGFLPDLQRILSYLPKQRTTLLFSATFSPEIKRLARQLPAKPHHHRGGPSERNGVHGGAALLQRNDDTSAAPSTRCSYPWHQTGVHLCEQQLSCGRLAAAWSAKA